MSTRVTVWHEYRHEKKNPKVAEIYPKGMHEAIASHLRNNKDLQVKTATLDEVDHGLGGDLLDNTDVIVWWGHVAHGDVKDEIVNKVHERVLQGMGIVVLHSGHFSKIFKKLMGTTCDLKWREDDNEREILWVTRPGHPIVEGIQDFDVCSEQYYMHTDPSNRTLATTEFPLASGPHVPNGRFDMPVVWTRSYGKGKVFYNSLGHQESIVESEPCLTLMRRGFLWAAK